MNNLTLYSLLVDRSNKKMLIKDGNNEISINELDNKAREYADILLDLGVQRKARIALQIGQHLSFLTFLLAGILLDVVIVPLYAHIGSEKLKKLLKDLDVNYLLREVKEEELTSKAIESFGINIFCYELTDKVHAIDKDIILIMQTSGTTAVSKGVMLSFDNIYSNIVGISDYLELKKQDRILIIKSTNHISTIIGELLVGLYTGTSMICISNTFQLTHLNMLINIERISVLFAVPYILRKMLSEKVKCHNMLRIVNFYGEKMAADEIKELLKYYPKTNFIYSYGQTEASPRVTYIKRNDLERKSASSGKTIKGVSMYISDVQGKMLPPYCEGEIIICGPNVMRGYYNNQKLTQEVIVEGKLHSGDIGYMDDEGYLYVTGRKDNMLVVAGKNIHPEEIEMLVLTYPGVKEVLVCSKVYKRVVGLVMYLVESEKAIVDIKQLYTFLRSSLEDYKVPREILIVPKLERTESGKIIRRHYVKGGA